MIDFENIDINCNKTWSLISEGKTKGVFQLESRLGQSMAKKLKPENIEQLGALISILRPGCLEAFRDGKSVSNHYIDKKNNLESIDYFHPSLEPILKPTYGEMVYQEQAMQICQHIANFDLSEADMLRKAIGKKNAEEMSRIKNLFIEKSNQTNIVSDVEAEQIFGWIEKSQRYSFNKSHAISYAMNAFVSAYAKAHFTIEFFVSYLRFAKDKIDPMREVYELINDAISFDMDIRKPDLRLMNKEFIIKNDKIYFGLTNIKGVGNSVYDKIETIIKENNLDIQKMSLNQLMFLILDKINSAATKSIISSGCLDYLKISRKKILFLQDIISNLSQREKSIIIDNSWLDKDLSEILNLLLPHVNKKRADKIQSLIKLIAAPAYSLDDNYEWIANTEKKLLGIAMTCSIVDSRNLESANTDCQSLSKGKIFSKNIIVGAEIDDINIVVTKKGKNPGQQMAFIKISDGTGCVDIITFPKEYEEYKDILYQNNTVMFRIEQSKNKESLFVKKCWQI